MYISEHICNLQDGGTSATVGSRLLDNGVNSCGSLYRVCVSLSGVQSRIYYIVFPNAAGSDRVYLAETIFYTDTSSCGPDTLVTEPITPPG